MLHALNYIMTCIGYERMYLSLYKVSDTLIHVQVDDVYIVGANFHMP